METHRWKAWGKAGVWAEVRRLWLPAALILSIPAPEIMKRGRREVVGYNWQALPMVYITNSQTATYHYYRMLASPFKKTTKPSLTCPFFIVSPFWRVCLLSKLSYLEQLSVHLQRKWTLWYNKLSKNIFKGTEQKAQWIKDKQRTQFGSLVSK